MESDSIRPLNRLLLALPADDLNALARELEHNEHQQGAVLMEAGGSLEHVFFPATGVLSLVAVYPNGDLLQAATVGREGCSGVEAVFGAASSSFMISVPISGSFLRMSLSAFQHSVKSMQSFRNLMLAYLQAFTEQVMLQSACCPHHSLKQRLARDLLALHDRTEGDMVDVTHDGLARMLNARRGAVTRAVRELQSAGLIESSRGEITILDRTALTKASCECYQLVRHRFARHLPSTYGREAEPRSTVTQAA